jgi:phage/plasmid-like protein (TIGR03299 family)
MAHEVETMAYRNAVPWHELGTFIEGEPTVEEMTRQAGLDWRVDKAPLITVPDNTTWRVQVPVPDHFALVRDKDDAVLGVCGKDYVPVQNHESMEFFRQFVDAGAATLETAGSLRGGKIIWALANLNDDFMASEGDVLKKYVLLSNSHEPGKSLLVKATAVRVVCANTLAMALGAGNAEFRMRHVRKFDSGARDEALEALGLARGKLAEFHRNATALKNLKMDAAQVEQWILSLVAPGATRVDDSRVAKAIMESYYNAPGAEPGTGWGALNAVTHYADHVAPTRKGNESRRLERAWFGDNAALKQLALDTLLVGGE